MAQDNLDALTDAVMQAESRGRRFGSDAKKLLESVKGAQGEMQVMPKTQMKPGYGVEPAKDKSGDEIARVGRDYLKAMVGKYGDQVHALAAYNWGPGNTDKWLADGADMSKLPAETRKYIREVQSNLQSRLAQQGPGKTKEPVEVEPMMNAVQRSGVSAQAPTQAPASAQTTLAQLGPNYQAALALNTIAEQDEKDAEDEGDKLDDWQRDKEMEAEIEGGTAKRALAALEGLSFQSPVAGEQQPVRMATGGAVRSPVYRAEGSPMGGENVDHMTPQEIERMAAAQQPAFMTPGSGRGRTAGPISQALKSGDAYIAAAKGVTELPYDIAGAPVDLATMAMRPFGYSTEKPVMGSDWIKEKMTALNVRPEPPADPTLKGFYTIGELGSNLVNPAAVARKAGPIVEQGAKALGKETARQVLRGMEGEGMLAPISPPMAFAVKPRGGTFATSGSVDAPPISYMDEILEVYRNALKNKFPADQHDVVDLLVDKKMRKYFTNEYGTANDPLRTAMRSGEFPVHGTDVENFPEYLLAAARNPNAEGHAQAKRHLEKFYDDRTGINLKALGLGSSSDADARSRFNTSVRDFERKQREAMTAEGLPAEFQNTPYIDKYTLEDTKAYPNSTRVLRNMVAAGEEGRLPPGQVWALKNEQPIYDIDNPRFEFLDPKVLAETIQSLDPKKLKNMSFDQAVIEGTKNMQVFREYDTAVERAAKGLSVPKEVVSMFTKPVLKTDAGEWVQLTNPAATKLEGKLLHHSIGGYADNPNYNLGGPEAFRSGKAQVFSLRQEKTALPEITIEAEKTKDGLKITQIKGDYNSFPSHRAEDVFKFMEKHPDIVHINSDYYPRNNVGTELEQKIGVDWQASYDHWKSGLPGDWVVTRDSPTRIDYVYGIPDNKYMDVYKKAQGGMMERNKGDNRRYL
jgi:hypothetical protein